MSAELSIYHQRRLRNARQRAAELREKKTTEMDEGELLLWLTRMEITAGDLLNLVDLLSLAAGRKL
jgi:hypothetical protein